MKIFGAIKNKIKILSLYGFLFYKERFGARFGARHRARHTTNGCQYEAYGPGHRVYCEMYRPDRRRNPFFIEKKTVQG